MKEVGAGGGSHPPPKGSLPNFPSLSHSVPTLGQQLYFPTQPPLAFLFPSARPGALASRPRGPAVPPAPSLETFGEGLGSCKALILSFSGTIFGDRGPVCSLDLSPVRLLGPHGPGASGSS